MSNQRVRDFQGKYPVFEYAGYKWELRKEDLWIQWMMEEGDLRFAPNLTIFGASEGASRLNKDELDNLVFHLGLAETFSYWKATCSPTIKISAGYLSEDQMVWWHDLLMRGMGQYFYTNQIDFREDDFVKMESTRRPDFEPISSSIVKKEENARILVPVGGGKDSAMTLDLLSNNFGSAKVGAFAMNLARGEDILPAAKRLIEISGIQNSIRVQRDLDPKLFTLKSAGYLDGHVPFTAYLSFLSILIARLFGYQTIAFSNERSSNEANLEYLGQSINHQYSKCFEFENLFREYNSKYLTNVNYFSFLRPLYELQIAKIFSATPKYFSAFRSCNRGYLTDSWCGQCAKCLATYVGLYPFVNQQMLLNIFGHDLFGNNDLMALTKDILGAGKGKPFECVGTFEETIVAFYLSLKKHLGGSSPILLKYFEKEILPKYPDVEELTEKILLGWDTNNNLAGRYQKVLSDTLRSS